MIEMKTDVSSDNAINIILLVQQTQDSSTTSHQQVIIWCEQCITFCRIHPKHCTQDHIHAITVEV